MVERVCYRPLEPVGRDVDIAAARPHVGVSGQLCDDFERDPPLDQEGAESMAEGRPAVLGPAAAWRPTARARSRVESGPGARGGRGKETRRRSVTHAGRASRQSQAPTTFFERPDAAATRGAPSCLARLSPLALLGL